MNKNDKKGYKFSKEGEDKPKAVSKPDKQPPGVEPIVTAVPKRVTPSQSLLQEIILATGYSQAQLARHLGLRPSTFHSILTGKIKEPSLATFQKILSLYITAVYLPKHNT